MSRDDQTSWAAKFEVPLQYLSVEGIFEERERESELESNSAVVASDMEESTDTGLGEVDIGDIDGRGGGSSCGELGSSSGSG
jgi:hypothetical protein